MIIAVEGLPQTGKSTLLSEICDALRLYGWRYVELIDHNCAMEFQRWIDLAKEQPILLHGSHLQFVDRWGGLGGMSLLEWSTVDDAMARNGAHLILLQDDPFQIETRMTEIGRTKTRDEIGLRQNYLNSLFESSTIPTKGRYALRQFVNEDGTTTTQFKALIKLIETRR